MGMDCGGWGVDYFQSAHSGLNSVVGRRSGGYNDAVGSFGMPWLRGRFAVAPLKTEGCDVSVIM